MKKTSERRKIASRGFKKGGWLESCIPTRDGHFYSLEIISAYNPTGKSILLLRIAAPPVSHHLNQLYASKFIQSLPVR